MSIEITPERRVAFAKQAQARVDTLGIVAGSTYHHQMTTERRAELARISQARIDRFGIVGAHTR